MCDGAGNKILVDESADRFVVGGVESFTGFIVASGVTQVGEHGQGLLAYRAETLDYLVGVR